MEKKRVGIITFNCAYNYGSALQAYALQTYLELQGFNVKIINYRLTRDFRQYKLFRTDQYLEYPRAFLSDIVHLKGHIKRKRSFENFWNSTFKLTNKIFYDKDDMTCLNQDFDVFICGSDQIWNLDCTGGIVPAYFLSFAAEDKLKIAYAPSIAHNKFSVSWKGDIKDLLDRFNYISVRERSTIPVFQEFTNNNIENTIDPTLLLDASRYDSILSLDEDIGEYIFVYILEDNQEIIEYCNLLAIKKNLKIIYIHHKDLRNMRNAHNMYGVSPGTFLSLIKNANYVITNSFHATVFSILYEKMFVSYATEKSGARVLDLSDSLKLSNRIYRKGFNIDFPIDYEGVEQGLEHLRLSSKKFLNNALSYNNGN